MRRDVGRQHPLSSRPIQDGQRQRTVAIVLGALAVFAAGVAVVIEVLDRSEGRPTTSSVTAPSRAPAPPSSTAPVAATAASPAPWPAASVVASAQAQAAPSVLWPEPEAPPPPAVSADSKLGDPFDSDAGRPHDVRELVRVGAIRLGVTNDSKVRNERAVTAVLTELGGEIDALERGRSDSFERRIMDYQSIFDRYRAKLAPHMDGSFAAKGQDGWTDTERLDAPYAGDGGARHAR